MNITSALPISSILTPASPETNSAPDPAKLAKACGQFEGMLVRQILQQGLKPLLATPPGSGDSSSDVYSYFVTDALANSVTAKRGIGIAAMLQSQLTHHLHHTTSNAQK
jgi:Rod binding domain-containing protein